MAEYINRAELIENLNKFAPEHYNALINQLITKQPTADVVKVIRCKDCVNRVEFDTNKFHCELTGYYCGEKGYCSDGTPKERGDEK